MVDMAKVHGIEKARAEVLRYWQEDTGLRELSDRYCKEYKTLWELQYDTTEWIRQNSEVQRLGGEWHEALGKATACSELYDILTEMIEEEYRVDEEVV